MSVFAPCPARQSRWIIGSAAVAAAWLVGVFPLVLIPAYGVPRSLLIHSYSLIGLLHKKVWRREHAISDAAKPALAGSDKALISATSRGQWLEF